MNKIAHLLFLLQTAKNFLFRSWRSTSVLAFMIFSATGTLVFLSALATGTSDAMIRNSIGLYSGHISGFELDKKISSVSLNHKNVKSVLTRDICEGLLSKGGKIRGIQLTGIIPDDEKANTGLWKKTIAGRFLTNQDKGFYLGVELARFLGVKAGDELFFSSYKGDLKKSYNIIGIFKTGLTEFDNNKVFCNINELPWLTKKWNAAVFLKEGADVDSLIQSYNQLAPAKNVFSAWYDIMPDLNQLIDMNKICMEILTIIVFTIVSIGVSCAFMIFILKNLREYGIMKSMGLSSSETVFLIFSEVFMMIFCASALGVVFGVIVVEMMSGGGIDISSLTSHNRYFIISGIIYPRLTVTDVLLPPMISLFFCILAAIWPAYTVSTSKIAKVVRSI